MLFGIFVFLLVIGIVFFGTLSSSGFGDIRKCATEAKKHAEKGDKQAEAEATKDAVGAKVCGYVCGFIAIFLFVILVYSTMTDDDSSPPVKPKPAPSAKACGTPVPQDNWSDLRTSLCNYQQDYNNQQASFKQVQQQISELDKAISTAEQLAKDYQAKKDDTLAKLQEVSKRLIDNPDISIDTERTAYRQAKLEFEAKQQALSQLQTQRTQATEEQKRVETVLQTTQNQINALEKQLKSAYFASFKAKVEQERVIEVEGESGCNQLTVQQCREAAEQEALQVASKQAAVNFLNAETLASLDPHGNLQLTKDEIRSQTRAVVMGHQILECKFVTPAGSAYSCKIRATVKGLVPPELEQQLLK